MKGKAEQDRALSLEKAERLIQWLKKNGIDTFSMIGGEPTLHPEFEQILEAVRTADMKAFVFSNGLMSDKKAACLAAWPDDQLGVLINVNDRDQYTDPEFQRLERTLGILSGKASLGYNLYSLDFDFRPVARMAVDLGCRKRLRLGLAEPILGGENAFLAPRDYPRIAERLTDQAEEIDRMDVAVGFDCGFVMCMFTTEQLGRLTACRAEISFACNPVVDISPALEAWACFPLTLWEKVRVEDFPSLQALQDHFSDKQRLYRRSGIYSHCLNCRFLIRGQCSGGCLSHVIRSFGRTDSAATENERTA